MKILMKHGNSKGSIKSAMMKLTCIGLTNIAMINKMTLGSVDKYEWTLFGFLDVKMLSDFDWSFLEPP